MLAGEAVAAAKAADNFELPLAGVPIAVKDDMPVGGQPTTRGSRSYGPPAVADCEAVRRLRAAGAIVIGVTNVPELTAFLWTATAANGTTRNPWNPTRTPGGSSGGSAAAVASGMVPAATGSDAGGSIRVPAACCGLVGMKPTRGRVPLKPASEIWFGMGVYGPLTGSVIDNALMLDVMRGAVPTETALDPAPPARPYRESAATAPPRLRVAISDKVPPGLIARLADERRQALADTGALLANLGHDIVQRDPDYGLAAIEAIRTCLRGVFEESLEVPDRSRLEPATRQLAALGRLATTSWQLDRLIARRRKTTVRILSLWDEVDVLVTPVLSTSPVVAEGSLGRSAAVAVRLGMFAPYTVVFNLTGQPALNVPVGMSADGLPLSVQLVGRPGAEDTLYALAGQIERVQPWTRVRPPS